MKRKVCGDEGSMRKYQSLHDVKRPKEGLEYDYYSLRHTWQAEQETQAQRPRGRNLLEMIVIIISSIAGSLGGMWIMGVFK